MHPELENASDNEAILDALVADAKRAWHALHRLAMTMEDRVKAVIAAEGWYTKY